jgi:hypothetical protein
MEALFDNKREIKGIGTLHWGVTTSGSIVLKLNDFHCDAKKMVMRLARSKRHYRLVHSPYEKPDGIVHLTLYDIHTKPLSEVVENIIKEVVKTIKITYYKLRNHGHKPLTQSKGYVNHRDKRRKRKIANRQLITM